MTQIKIVRRRDQQSLTILGIIVFRTAIFTFDEISNERCDESSSLSVSDWLDELVFMALYNMEVTFSISLTAYPSDWYNFFVFILIWAFVC